MEPARKLATYRDLFALPEDVRAEVLAGEIVALPAPLPRHGWVIRTVGSYVGRPFSDDDDGPGGWWILPEVDVELGDHDVVRPDLSSWRREHLKTPWDERPIRTRPDWVCEVLSPSNARHDRVTKSALYAQHGVPYYWLIDPVERTLEAYELDGDGWKVSGTWADDALARVPPFEAIELELKRLFPPEE
jgi:Uma2 family endonuclease